MLLLEEFKKFSLGSADERVKNLRAFLDKNPDNLFYLLDMLREVCQGAIEDRIRLDKIANSNKE